MEERLLKGLNESQKLAVSTTNGPVMVMAGAGSGKTRVLTHRIAYILEKHRISPYDILAVTFTNKAANEMKKRVSNLLSIDTRYMWISTFHSFCARLLRLEIDVMPPYDNHFNILDEEDSLKVVKEIFKEQEIQDFNPKEIRSLISKFKNFTNYELKNPIKQIFNQVYPIYEKKLLENNQLDFDDLIIKTIELLKKNNHILRKYQEKFKFILVDEFQDTNDLQYKLIYMLGINHHNIFVVGDDCQSIYSFRGANIKNINHFRDDFLETKLILLEKNYRSTKQILDLANCVIDNNPDQIKKVMYCDNLDGQKPFYYEADSGYDEVMFVIDKIRELRSSGYKYSDFAVLYRANYVSRIFEENLIKYQIPYKVFGGLSFFSQKEIKDIIAYLKLIINPKDDFSFKRIINEPKRGLGSVTLEKLYQVASESELSMFDAIKLYCCKKKNKALDSFYETIVSIREQLNNIPLKQIVDIIIDETGYKEMLKNNDEDERLENILEFKSVLHEIDKDSNEDNFNKLDKFLCDISLRTEHDNDDIEDDDCVRISTFHQVKGLEFKVVFMVAMEDGIFPKNRYLDDFDIYEERRICYVGITRAKEKLYLSSAQKRLLFGTTQEMRPSIFLEEINQNLYKNISKNYKKYGYFQPKTTLKILQDEKEIIKEKVDYSVGDKINHKVFGDGVIVNIDNDIIQVAFKVPYGIKKLKADHPAITKL